MSLRCLRPSRAALGLAVSLGAALSTTMGGWIADTAGVPIAFVALALVGVVGTLFVWLIMPETAQVQARA